MPRIKLNSHGFNEYTGDLGGIEFENGVSIDSVSRRDADRLGAICEVTDYDSGKQMNASQTFDEKLRSEQVRESAKSDIQPEPKPESVEEPETSVEETAVESVEPEKVYTEAELVVIANEQGIKALREIGEPLDVRGKSIREMIPRILKAQGSK